MGHIQCFLYENFDVRLSTGVENVPERALNLGQLQFGRATQCLKIDLTSGSRQWQQDAQDEAHVCLPLFFPKRAVNVDYTRISIEDAGHFDFDVRIGVGF